MTLNKKSKVTLRDIAAAVNLSPAAVSQILNNKEINYCSEATKERVRQAARDLGYRRNIGYKLMHHQSTGTVGIMIASGFIPQEEHYRTLILELLREFEERSLAAFCHIMPRNEKQALAKVHDYIARGVEHFVFIGCPTGWEKIDEECSRLGITAVFTREFTRRFVANDVTSGLEVIFRHLIGHCGENFKLLCSESWASAPENNRLDALQRIFPELSREKIIEKFIFLTSNPAEGCDLPRWAYETSSKGTADILRKYPDLKGIIFVNDLFAWGGSELLRTENYKKYRNLYLAGCNYNLLMRFTPLNFATVEFDVHAMVQAVADAALSDAPCRKWIPTIPHINVAPNSN
ncbi:MAG: LacI family DNA-binding transcriptional regulator [Lentisphaeria bacterium]|nr:LacI family DNA-binding transcriptional regulator [Lentisphaeria bacterium]